MTTPRFFRPFALALTLGLASTAHAQTADTKWSVDLAIGWDNSISGNINSSAIGSVNDQTVVVLTNQYEDVYGSGLHIRVGGGYKLNPNTEARVNLSFQSADADLASYLVQQGVSLRVADERGDPVGTLAAGAPGCRERAGHASDPYALR